MTVPLPKSDAMQALYWREEILQVMFWIQGEGFGDDIDPQSLGRFLGIDGGVGLSYLDRLVSDGYLEVAEVGRYRLSGVGKSEGAKIFGDEFADFTKPSHGECGADCWCHNSADEAEACNAERFQSAGHH